MTRTSSLLNLVCLLLACQLAISQTANRCLPFFTSQKVGFDLVPIETANQQKPYAVSLQPHTNDRLGVFVTIGSVEFNLCGLMTKPDSCPDVPGGAFAYYLFDGKCTPMIVLTSNVVREPITVDNKVNGVSLLYNNDNLDADKKKFMGPNVQFRVTCNKENTGVAKWSASINFLNGEQVTLTAEHASGCGKGIDDILDLFEQNKVICCIIFVGIGIIFAFFGRHAYKWTLMLCGFQIGFISVAGVCYSFGIFHNAVDSTKWIALASAIIVGLIVGFLLYKFEVATIMLVCGLLFVLITMAILTTFLASVEINKWLEIGILILAGALGAILGAYFKE